MFLILESKKFKGMRRRFLLLISAAISFCTQAQTTYTGHFDNIIGPCPGAYNLVANETVSYTGADTDKDMKNSDYYTYFNGSWESMNNTKFVQANSFDYENATETLAIQAYSQGTANTYVTSPHVDDIYIARIRETDEYMVIKITAMNADYDCTGSATNTGRLSFEYKKFDNIAPVTTNIPTQTVIQGVAFTPINLNDYVTDETADADIVWTNSTSADLTVSITNNIATISVTDANWTGSATITFTATDAGGLSSDIAATFIVSATADTEAPVKTTIPTITMTADNSSVVDLSQYFTDNSGFITYSYTSSDLLLCSIEGSDLTIYLADASWTGNTTVQVTATDPSGNSTSELVEINVPHTVSITNPTAETIGLFPNPAQEVFTLNIAEEAQITISDANGHIVLQYRQKEKQHSFNIAGFAAGMYFVKIQSANHTETIPLLVQ